MEASKLAEAICAIMGEVGYVQKTGRNDHHRYTYTSDKDLLDKLQPAMSRHGLSMFPTHIDRIEVGKRTDLMVTYELRHVSGETATVMAPGSGADTQDKGAYKAMTGAYKYALRQTFAIPTGDDAEKDENHPTGKDISRERRQEAPGQTEQRQSEHDPSWEADRKAFCAAITKASGGAFGYDDVKAWTVTKGWGSPSSWISSKRAGLIGAIEGNKNNTRDDIIAHKGE